MSENIEYVPTDSLTPDVNQPRREFNEETISELSDSYKDHGIIIPIEIDENGTIIIGERRWRAAKKAGIENVPIRRVKGLDVAQRLERQLVEEGHKEKWSPTETGWAYATAIININEEKNGTVPKRYTIDEVKKLSRTYLATLLDNSSPGQGVKGGQSELSRRTGFKQRNISYFLSLIQAEPETQKAIDEKEVHASYIYEIQQKTKAEELKPVLEKAAIGGAFKTRNEVRETIKTLNESRLSPEKQIEAVTRASERKIPSFYNDIEEEYREDYLTTPSLVESHILEIEDEAEEQIEEALNRTELKQVGREIGEQMKEAYSRLDLKPTKKQQYLALKGKLLMISHQLKNGTVFHPTDPTAHLIWSNGDTIEKTLELVEERL